MKVRRLKSLLCVLGVSAAVWGTTARGDEANAILDLLERKGLITADEAAAARKYYDQQQAEAVAKYDKPTFGSWLEKVGFYGDARLRFESRSGENYSDDNRDRDRWRYRLRFGLKGEYQDNFLYGLRLETSDNPRSTNITFGDDPGPFGKGNDIIRLGQLYLGWKPTDWLTLIGGRQENPFITSSMVWDGDLNPEGGVEKFSRKSDKVEWFANFGQFIYADFNENNFGGGGQGDVWMFGWQTGAKVKLTKNSTLTVAPTLYNYVNANNYSATAFNGGPNGVATNNAAINDLLVVEIPVELAFKIRETVPAKVFGDFAVNVRGGDRARAAGFPTMDDQIYAYQVGLSVGSAKKKHGIEGKVFWQHAELFALDPNLVDSDIFDSRLNMQGIGSSVTYAFTDFLYGAVTYAYGTNIKDSLPTLAGAGDLGSNLQKYQLIQADLGWKF
jgi:hypothetical protein